MLISRDWAIIALLNFCANEIRFGVQRVSSYSIRVLIVPYVRDCIRVVRMAGQCLLNVNRKSSCLQAAAYRQQNIYNIRHMQWYFSSIFLLSVLILSRMPHRALLRSAFIRVLFVRPLLTCMLFFPFLPFTSYRQHVHSRDRQNALENIEDCNS